MHLILWEFEPRQGKEAEFEQAYGANGAWAGLFAHSDDYRGTELLKSTSGRTYLTVDRWTSAEAFTAFQQQWRTEYAELDQAMESLTVLERPFGTFDST